MKDLRAAIVVDVFGDLLAELVRPRPAWHADALCKEYPRVQFFPEKGQSTRPAKAVCARCAVRDLCLADALATAPTEDYGVRGGTSPGERATMRRAARRRAHAG